MLNLSYCLKLCLVGNIKIKKKLSFFLKSKSYYSSVLYNFFRFLEPDNLFDVSLFDYMFVSCIEYELRHRPTTFLVGGFKLVVTSIIDCTMHVLWHYIATLSFNIFYSKFFSFSALLACIFSLSNCNNICSNCYFV